MKLIAANVPKITDMSRTLEALMGALIKNDLSCRATERGVCDTHSPVIGLLRKSHFAYKHRAEVLAQCNNIEI